MGIDTTNVKLMSQFKGAIEEYVEAYVSKKLNGVHGKSERVIEGGFNTDQNIDFSINLPINSEKKHYGIIDICNVGAQIQGASVATSYAAPQARIFIWWDDQNNFKYSIAQNTMLQATNLAFANPIMRVQYVVEDSIELTSDGNLKFTIKDCCWNHYTGNNKANTYGGRITIDYHIW